MNKVRIISIDGGGIRGIVPAIILQAIEEKIKERTNNKEAKLVDFVDLVAGTGTGGVIACALLTPSDGKPSHPKYTAQEIASFFIKYSSIIYRKPLLHKIKTLWGFTDEKYPDKTIVKNLNNEFDDIKLSQLVKPCLIPAYDISSRKALFFTQHGAKITKAKDFFIKDVARATSASPNHFQVAHIPSLLGIEYPLIGGDIYAANPSMCVYAEARKMNFEKVKHPTAKDLFLLSLGTGNNHEPIPYIEAKNFGPAQWMSPIISVIMSSNVETVSFQLKWLFDAEHNNNGYIRISPELMEASPDIDDASKTNQKALVEAAHNYISKNSKTIDQIVDNLVPIADTLS